MSDQRPGILTTVAIIGIVLGSLGLLGSLAGVAGALIQGQLADFQPPPQMQAAGQDFAERIQALAAPYFVPNVIGMVANLLISILLIVGGALILARKPSAPGLMLKTMIASIVVALYNTGLGAYTQIKMMPVLEEMMLEAAADLPPGSGVTPDIMSIIVWASTAFAVFWLACKLVYYIVTIVALRRPDTQAWFSGPTEG